MDFRYTSPWHCPVCGGQTRVVWTRPHRLGTKRRRECAQKHRHTTMQASEAVYVPEKVSPF